jgi:hypothetical protein
MLVLGFKTLEESPPKIKIDVNAMGYEWTLGC